jgi:hypothetical protein
MVGNCDSKSAASFSACMWKYTVFLALVKTLAINEDKIGNAHAECQLADCRTRPKICPFSAQRTPDQIPFLHQVVPDPCPKEVILGLYNIHGRQ